MSRKARYPVTPPQDEADLKSYWETLKHCASPDHPEISETDRRLIRTLLNAFQCGLPKLGMRPLSHFPIFKPHIDAAIAAKNEPLLACLTFALFIAQQFELHIPPYAAKVYAEINRGRQAANNRDGKSAVDLVEAWERDNGATLSSRSPISQIEACARSIDRKESTVIKALRVRQRG